MPLLCAQVLQYNVRARFYVRSMAVLGTRQFRGLICLQRFNLALVNGMFQARFFFFLSYLLLYWSSINVPTNHSNLQSGCRTLSTLT